MFLGGNLISWSSKHQNVVSLFSTEVEYSAMANGLAEECWLRQLLMELHSSLSWASLVYYDNVSAVYLSTNPVQHQRNKHVEIDPHIVHKRVAIEDVRVLHVLMTSQFVDIYTKGLPYSVFSEFWSSLNICSALQENSMFSSASLKTDERTTTSVGQRWPTDEIVIFVGFR
jgi:hypothetical protein